MKDVPFEPQVETIHVEGMQFVSNGPSRVAVVMDASEEAGGKGSGVRPMELVLHALAGCTAMDVVSILTKMRQTWDDFRIVLRAERAPDHPRVYTRIQMAYVFRGDLDPARVKKAITLSRERYCSVSAMLGKTAEMEVWMILQDRDGNPTVKEKL